MKFRKNKTEIKKQQKANEMFDIAHKNKEANDVYKQSIEIRDFITGKCYNRSSVRMNYLKDTLFLSRDSLFYYDKIGVSHRVDYVTILIIRDSDSNNPLSIRIVFDTENVFKLYYTNHIIFMILQDFARFDVKNR